MISPWPAELLLGCDILHSLFRSTDPRHSDETISIYSDTYATKQQFSGKARLPSLNIFGLGP